MTITIEAARPTDLPAVLALLERSGLPQEQCYAGSLWWGVLLPSVALDPALRGHGLGWRLTRRALDVARQRGIATVYLLTETAGDFFPRFGFRRIERAAVEPAVQQSIEFISACPASAQVLVVSLSSA
jgi:amino-acid N-acetyltransferase